MRARCIHGFTWFRCPDCFAEAVPPERRPGPQEAAWIEATGCRHPHVRHFLGLRRSYAVCEGCLEAVPEQDGPGLSLEEINACFSVAHEERGDPLPSPQPGVAPPLTLERLRRFWRDLS